MKCNIFIDFWEAHPFLRILFPLTIGIAIADVGDGFSSFPILAIAFFLLLLFLAGMFVTLNINGWRNRAWSGYIISLFFFTLGVSVYSCHWQKVDRVWSNDNCIYEGKLVDGTRLKQRSVLCTVQLARMWKGDSCVSETSRVLLYLPKDSLASTLQAGSEVRFHGKINSPCNTSFSGEFDYAKYLRRQSISGTIFSSDWQVLACSEEDIGLRVKALRMRDKLLRYYRFCGLSGEELAVFSALTLGYKNELSEEIKELYSVSGASHILALSGLHIGILCMVLTVLLKMLIPVRRLLWLRRLLVISAVWIFVFVVGLPVSAVRAAIMFSLLMLGSCFTRVGFTLNTLAVAAFGMLLYNPFYLFDVGFQMSFSAVAAILLLQPVTQRLIKPCDNRVMRYFLEIISVSLAAQVGVAPLVMFYFSRFSVYFLLTNIFVVPLAFVIVSLALVLLFAGLLPWKILQLGVGWCIQYIIKIMNIGLAFISTLPGSSIDGFSLSIGELICLYCTLFFLGFWFVKKYRKALVWSLLSVWCGCVLHLYTVLALNQHEVLRIGLSQGRPVIQWLRANEICTLTSDSLRCNVAHVNGVAVMKGKNVCLLNNDYWQNKTTASVFPIDYLYICKGYKGSLMHLLSLFDVQCVILDSSLSEYYRGKLMDECVAGNIKYIDLSAQGNLEVSL